MTTKKSVVLETVLRTKFLSKISLVSVDNLKYLNGLTFVSL